MRKKLTSFHGLIKNVYDYGEEIIFRILKINSGIEFVKIELISLNTNDGILKELESKPIIIQMTKYKNDKKTGRTLKRVSEETATQLLKSG